MVTRLWQVVGSRQKLLLDLTDGWVDTNDFSNNIAVQNARSANFSSNEAFVGLQKLE